MSNLTVWTRNELSSGKELKLLANSDLFLRLEII